MSRLHPSETQRSCQPRATPASPRRARRSTRSVRRTSWRSPRCNVGAGPAPTPRHPSAPREGVWWALAFPGSMANAKGGGLLWVEGLPGAQLQGARGRLGVEGWTPPPWCLEPGSVFPGARGSASPKGWARQVCRRQLGMLGAPGVGEVICPGFPLGPWAQRANTSVSRAGVAAAVSAL